LGINILMCKIIFSTRKGFDLGNGDIVCKGATLRWIWMLGTDSSNNIYLFLGNSASKVKVRAGENTVIGVHMLGNKVSIISCV